MLNFYEGGVSNAGKVKSLKSITKNFCLASINIPPRFAAFRFFCPKQLLTLQALEAAR